MIKTKYICIMIMLLLLIGCGTLKKNMVTNEYPINENNSNSASATTTSVNDVYFGYDDAALTAETIKVLVEKAKYLRDNNNVVITIEGHCDERGTNEYNIALGERRAQSIANFLINAGVNPTQVKTISLGEESPVAYEHNEEAWAKNRRGHFVQ